MFNKFYPVATLQYLIALLLCMGAEDMLAQGRAENNWIFSNGQWLQFNFSDDTLADQTRNTNPAGGEGSIAVATDPASGEVLFYTNGATLYDTQGQTFGPNLGGDPDGNQEVVIAPVPGDDRSDGVLEYYVFVNVNGTIRYYTVNVTVDGNGFSTATVVGGPTNTGVSGISGPMMVIPGEDTYYIVAHEDNSPTYRVIDAGNPTAPQTYNLGTAGANSVSANSFAYHEATGQLAVASDQGVQIISFNPATGEITYENNIGGIGDTYDVAWSGDGSKLYISTGGGIRQYNVETGQLQAIAGIANAFGLKRGPDGNVYYLYEEPADEFKLGRIVDADSVPSLVSNETALFDGADFGGPRFSETTPGPQPEYALSIQQVGQCANNPVQLIPEFPAGTPDPDSMVWYIGNQTFRGVSPTITPEQSTSVGVIAYWGGDSVVVTGGVQVQDFQLQVPLVQDTTICPGDMATLKAKPDSGGQQGGGGGTGGGGTGGGGNYTYYWSTGETTDSIQVNQAGVYWVLVTDQSSGCTAYAESNVKEYQVLNQIYNTWYFGNGAGIDFNTLWNRDDPSQGGQITPLGDGAQDAPEGVASVSDANGEILFYTDGQTVYFKDRITGDHVELPIADQPPGTEGIGGDPTATQVAIVQVPNADGLYYIFTTTEVEGGGYALRYSIFDLRKLQVVSSNNLLFTKSTERIAIFGGNGSNAVLIAHEYGNNVFRSYPITSEGIGEPVTSSVGSVHSFDNPEEAEGYMKIGGDSTGTVVGVAVDGRVELFNFDLNTLKLSEPASADLPGDRQGYGLEIVSDSSGNTVVYVTTNDGIYAATIDRPLDEGASPNMVQVSNTGGQAFGAIQQGSDGQLYVARPGANNLGVLAPNPNNPAQSGYNDEGIPGGLPNGATSGLGLPNEVRMGGNAFPEPGISVSDACVGGEVSFTAQGRDDVIETYFWEIIRLNEDGTRTNIGLPDSLASAQAFNFAIDTLGNFLAQVTLSNPCDEDSVMTQEFTMNNGIEVALPESINLCNGTVDLNAVDPADDDGTLTFEWVQVGAVGGGNLPNQNTITVDEEGTYQVTVTTAEGCTSEGEVFVVDNRPDVELPNDFTLCVGETRELDVEIPSPADPGYEWVILDNNGTEVSTSNEPVIEVADLTPNPGIYLYTVTVTDDSPEGCFVQDTVVVTIMEAPEIEVAVLSTTGCQAGDGGAKVNFLNGEDPSEFTYTWTNSAGDIVGTEQILGQDPDNPNLNPNIPSVGVPAGMYTVTISTPNGCTIRRTASIEDEYADFDFEATASANSGCDDDEGFIDVEVSNPGTPVEDLYPITWTLSGDTLMQGSVRGDEIGASIPINGLSSGTYHLELRSKGGCVQSQANIEIPEVDEDDVLQFDAPRQVNACGVNVDVEVEFNIEWLYSWYREDGTPITENQAGANSVTVDESGVYTVEVSDPSNPALCPGREEIRVRLEEPFNVNIRAIEPDNSCETGERQLTLDFEPEGAENRDFIYNWTLDGNPLPNAGRTITVTQSGDYGVSVRERNSACIATDVEPVDVSQPVTVNIFFNAGCADGSDIPLFASVRTNETEPLEYAWFDPSGNRLPPANTVGDSLLVSPDMPEGEYRVEVSTAGGCVAEGLAMVRRNPIPEINFESSRLVICSQDPDPEINSVELSVGPAPEIVWTLPNGNQLFNTPTVVADEGGTYKVEMTNASGCTTVDSVVVVDDCLPRIIAPNVFRPGGKNNEFFVYHRYVAEDNFEVQIYNRWGELVYQSNDRDFRWDGTYKGIDAPLGTYPYVIRYRSSTDENGKVYEDRGGVTILR